MRGGAEPALYRSQDVARRSPNRRHRVEGLKTRALLTVTFANYPLTGGYVANGGVTLGPDGGVWFGASTSNFTTGVYGKGAVGEINPTNHDIALFPTRSSPASQPLN